jgi:cell filamentation protein
MPDEAQHRDRYDVSGNVEAEYFDEQQLVLVNKLGLRDLDALLIAEEEALAKAYETLLSEIRTDTAITCQLLKRIHAAIFGDLYAWAGRWRTVSISKPGVTWPPPLFVPKGMEDFEKNALQKHSVISLTTDELFCRALAEIQGEFLVVHPFREGNARTIKLACDLLAIQTGRPMLLYDQSEVGRERYILAADQAFNRDYRLLTSVIQAALQTAREKAF